MSALFVLPFQVPFQSSAPLGLAKLYFYRAGTTTDQTVYTTAALSVAHDQPVRSTAAGVFPPIYLNPAASYDYRIILKDENDAAVTGGDVDNIPRRELSQTDFNAYLALSDPYKITAAEIAASVIPVNYAYEPGNILRYGADPTGVANSDAAFTALEALAAYCWLPEGTYKTSLPFTISGFTCHSYDAHINYTHMTADEPAVLMLDNSALLGAITITMPDGDLGVDVNHLRVGGGRAYTDGASHVRIGKVTVLGGHDTMAAVLVEGASSDVYIEEVYCPDNDKIGQVFGCHWGNFNQHYLSGADYVHTEGADPTTHPRGVRLDRLIVGVLSNSDGIENAAAFISSSRDISIGYLYVEEAAYAATIYPGDISFEYADATTQSTKMYGIEIETCIGNTRRGGLFITGSTSFASVATSDASVGFKSKYVNLRSSTTTGNAYPGISTDRCNGVVIDDCRLRFYDSGIALGLLSRNVRLTTPRIEDVDKQGINIAGTLSNECANVTIVAPYVSNCNRDASTDASVGSAITTARTQGLTIIGGILGASAGDTQRAAFSATATAVGVVVENVKTFGSTSNIGFYADAAPTDQVSFLNCSVASGMTHRSGGQAIFTADGKKIAYMATVPPTTGTWGVGDQALIATPVLGSISAARCTVAGTPGTWVVTEQAGTETTNAATPEFVGQMAVSGGQGYIAIATGSSADWLQIT